MTSEIRQLPDVCLASDEVFVFPTSFAQRRLWFLEQLERELVAYNIPFALRLRGDVDAESLRRGLELIVHRHEPLRTIFRRQGGEPVQVIQPPQRFDLPVVDLRDLPPDQRAAAVTARRREEAARPFDLATDLMLRAALLVVADEEHVLLLTLHHIAADGWSLGILWRELAAAYAAYLRNADPALAELPVQYADYAVWQQNELEEGRQARLLQYWQQQLAGLAVLELPTDHARPSQASYQGANFDFEVPRELVEQLGQLGRREGVTLHMCLLAAFQTLLARYSGQDDIAVGVPIAGRSRAELEPLIGFFVNTLVLRTDLSGAPTFRELLRRVRRVSLEAYDHQDLPFEKLVEELQPERHLNRSPLVQVLFQLWDLPGGELSLSGLEVLSLPSAGASVRFDLELHLSTQAAGLRGTVVYSTCLFDPSTIGRLVGHYLTLLAGIVADPDRHLSELPWLTEPERQQLLVSWNDTAVEYPRDRCVQELFEEQVARTPDAVAVSFADQQLSYRELNARANQLAHHLRSLGVGPEVLVGLCLERAPEMIIGLLGILKAGGAYLPLDMEDPPARLEFMLRDAAVPYLVTRQSLRERLPPAEYRAICLDTAAPQLEAYPATNLPADVAAEHLAYVIYTSGSTGQPKGVQIQHRSIVRLVLNTDYATWGRDRVFLQLAPISFDAATWEIWGALLHGAKLVIAPPGRPEFSELGRLIQRHGVTTLWLTATLFNQVVEYHPELLETVAEVLTGGEVLSVRHIRIAQQRLPDVRLVNGYGPTENTTFAACYRIPRCLPAALVSIPIGRPIANTQVYVLDPQRQLVPIGVPGELYLAGAGLARGYLHRPQLTAEKFVPHPFNADPAARLYRTGDQVRWRADGNLEFLGRLDDQIKLRGFRIELGEIEAALQEHPAVRQCVVALREDRPGEKRLVGYYVRSGERPVSHAELTHYLREQIPDYMVPASWVELPQLPLTSSGKLDRRALPAPDQTRPELDTAYTPPRTGLEEQLSAIWCEVLGLERVGSHDDFFALGGHSLLATRVMARVSAVLQVELPLRRLFELPTIAQLAAEISARRSGETPPPSRALVRRKREPLERLPLSFGQQRLWFLEQVEGALTAYNIPFAWRIHGPLNEEALRQAFEIIVARHEPLRTTFTLDEGVPRQVIQASARFELPVVDLGGLAPHQQEAEITERCRAEAERPFDLTRDRMLRAALLRLSADEQVLLVTLHHIASDGWSVQVLWQELNVLYQTEGCRADTLFGELPLHYADYAAWQRQALAGPRLATLRQYWRQQLAGVRALELPTDHPRPPQSTYRGARHDFTLGSELVQQLRSLSQTAGVTLHMTLLATFQTLLSRYSGQDDIAVATPTAGRQHVEWEPLIGFFVNTLVLRTDLSGDPTFRELLARVRQVALAAYDHQDLPFEQLVEELQPERHLNRNPLADVLFQWLSFGDQDLALQGVTVSRLPPASSPARFDLELHLWQQRESHHGTVIYSTDLFDPSTIGRLVGHYLTLLAGIVADPDRHLSELPWLTEPERQQLLVSWNDTAVEYPRDRCVQELFEEQVARTPDAVAVSFADQQLSYRELNARANQLAHHLRSLGVGPEVLVGLCLERAPEMIIGLLGILKAGGAYLPLDPTYPRARLNCLLDDAQPPVLLTQGRLIERLSTGPARVVDLDLDAELVARESRANPVCSTTPSDSAYLIYTSGSTGAPKGVPIAHRAVVNLLTSMGQTPGLRAQDVWLAVTTLSFDIAALELFLPLVVGARVVMISREVTVDGAQLAQRLRDCGATIMQATPATWRLLLEAGWEGHSHLTILCGGEMLPRELANQLLHRGAVLWNLYGPTETTIWSAVYRVEAGTGLVPMGRPIANTQMYVLDRHRQLVPIGVPGELCIGGIGLAKGYRNQPELTAEKFVPHPFDAAPAARLYRTGDLVRWRADGNLEFLGRLDDQIKLRGFRIEPAEIEAALTQHPQVRAAVVMLRADGQNDQYLVAYVVPRDEHPPELRELRSALRERLPEYMLPSAVVVLDALPLTPNGKVDRRALPAPDATPPASGSHAPPRSALERELAQLWCELLGVQSVGIHDDFFLLGGNSLLAVRLFAQVKEKFHEQLSVATLFQRPTIAHLAEAIARPDPTNRSKLLAVIQPTGPRPPLFCVHGTGGEVLFQLLPLLPHLAPDQPIYGLRALGLDGDDEPDTDIRVMAARYVAALRTVAAQGPYNLAGFSAGGVVAFEMAQQLRAQGDDVALLVIVDQGPPNAPRPTGVWTPREMAGFFQNLCRWIVDDMLQSRRDQFLLRVRGKLRVWAKGILRRLRRTTSEPEAVDIEAVFGVSELPPRLLKLIQTSARALAEYEPRKYPGTVDLFRARTDRLGRPRILDLGWGGFASGGVRVHTIPGTHASFADEPNVCVFAETLTACLEEARMSIANRSAESYCGWPSVRHAESPADIEIERQTNVSPLQTASAVE